MSDRNQDITGTIVELADEDPQVRRDAAWSLGEKKSQEGVSALVFALGDKNRGCQEAAMEALVKIGGPKAVEHLLPLVANRNAYIRTATVEVLERIGGDAGSLIIELLQDQASSVRIVASDLVGKLHIKEAVPQLLKELADENSNVRCAVLKALGEIGGEETLESIRSSLNDPEEWVCVTGIEALGRSGCKETLSWLIEKLKDPSRSLVWAAVESIGKLGYAEAVPSLLEVLENESVVMRNHVVHNLVHIAEAHENDIYDDYELARYELFFVEALESSEREVQDSALKALKRIGSQQAIFPIMNLLKTFRENEEERIVLAEGTLCTIGTGDEVVRYLQSVSRPLQNEDELTVKICGRVLSHLKETNTVSAILPFVYEGSESVRRVMIRALGLIGNPLSTTHLMDILKDPNGHIRREAAQALGCIEDEGAVLPLFSVLDREDYGDVRESILQALLNIGGKRVKEKFREFIFYPDPKIKELAIQAIGQIGDQEACDHMIANLGNENYQIRKRVVEALGILDCERMIDPLVYCLSDEHEKVRLAAIDVLSGKPCSKVVQGLICCLYDVNSWIAYQAAVALGSIGDADAVEPMIEVLEETGDVPLKIGLIRALRQIDDPRADPVLQRMQNDTNPDVRELFVEQLDD